MKNFEKFFFNRRHGDAKGDYMLRFLHKIFGNKKLRFLHNMLQKGMAQNGLCPLESPLTSQPNNFFPGISNLQINIFNACFCNSNGVCDLKFSCSLKFGCYNFKWYYTTMRDFAIRLSSYYQDHLPTLPGMHQETRVSMYVFFFFSW